MLNSQESIKAILDSATVFCMHNLVEIAKEMRVLQGTGELPQGKLQELADLLTYAKAEERIPMAKLIAQNAFMDTIAARGPGGVPFEKGAFVDDEGVVRDVGNPGEGLTCLVETGVVLLCGPADGEGGREVFGEFTYYPSLDAIKALGVETRTVPTT